MQILTNINTLSKDDLHVASGAFDLNLLARLRTDGVWSLGNVNMHVGFEFSPIELTDVHNRLGPGYIVAEDGSFTTVNYASVRSLVGYVDDYMSYNEDWFPPPSGPPLPPETSTTLSGARVAWVLSDLVVTRGITDVSRIAVSTRSYVDGVTVFGLADHYLDTPAGAVTTAQSDYWQSNIDDRLSDQRISGICIEMFPSAENFFAWRLDLLLCKALDRGKKVYLLLPPEMNAPSRDYLVEMKDYVDAIRQTGRLSDHRLYLVPSIYGTAGTTWFGPTNSIESAISFLKQQPEWRSEWPIAGASTTSPSEPSMPISQVCDGLAETPWSSKPRQQNERTSMEFYWDGTRPVNYIRLRPRIEANRALGFPVDFDLYYTIGTGWVLIRPIRGFLAPSADEWITISLGQVYQASGIHIAAIGLGADDAGVYRFQLMEVAAGFASPIPTEGTPETRKSKPGRSGRYSALTR